MKKIPVHIIDHELVSPIAIGKNQIIKNIEANISADGPIQNFNCEGLPFTNGAEIRQELTGHYENETANIKRLCVLDRKMELLAAAYGIASERLHPLLAKLDSQRTGVILGVGAEVLPLKEHETEMVHFIEKKQKAIQELLFKLNDQNNRINSVSNPYDIYSLYLADKFNAQAFQRSILTACVSSTQAVAQAYDAISRGEADVVIAGGTDSILNLIALVSFGKLGVIPETKTGVSCMPFDANRSGTIAGEAAGFIIMASDEFVRDNQLKPLVSVLGYGNTLDAYKITAPDPSASSMIMAIDNALSSAGLRAEQIDYYFAHGTGTRQNDGTELKAIETVFKNHAPELPISSTKDRHGHAISAAGNQELSILIELMQHDLMPANLNLKTPITDRLNLLRKNTRKQLDFALSSNFAFGGINTVLAIQNQKTWT